MTPPAGPPGGRGPSRETRGGSGPADAGDRGPDARRFRGSAGDDEPRTIDWAAASHALLPVRVRYAAIEVSVETDGGEYERGDPVRFRVRMRNRLPFPVAIRTRTAELWTWSVDGAKYASRVEDFDPPARGALLKFRRRETKTFHRTWTQRIRTAPREWSAVAPGDYELVAAINVEDAAERGLAAGTTLRIR